jgi:uncharacterized phage protein gp47/JayE
MSYSKTFDDILEGLLSEWRTQFPDADTSVGSMIFIKCSALASALWSAYRYQDWIARQSFVDTCDSETLDRHAGVYGLTRISGENDAAFAGRLLSHLRKPPAGGNRYDWLRWPKDPAVVYTYPVGSVPVTAGLVYVHENPRGGGSINVAITGAWNAPALESGVTYDAGAVVSWAGRTFQTIDGGTSSSSEPDGMWTEITGDVPEQLKNVLTEYLDTVRPVGLWDYAVYGITKKMADVWIEVPGTTGAQRTTIKNAIEQYIRELEPGKTLFWASVVAIAVENGAEDVNATPENTVPSWGPTVYEKVWPQFINVVEG